MLNDLARDELSDVAGADDDRVLSVARMTSTRRACHASAECDEDRCGTPEQREFLHRRVDRAGQRGEKVKQPREDRHELEDGDELIDRRMVCPLLVAVVEPAELGGENPEREHCRGDADLGRLAEPIEAVATSAREQLSEPQCGRQSENVSEQERAPDQPAAAVTACLRRGRRRSELAPGSSKLARVEPTHASTPVWVGCDRRPTSRPLSPAPSSSCGGTSRATQEACPRRGGLCSPESALLRPESEDPLREVPTRRSEE